MPLSVVKSVHDLLPILSLRGVIQCVVVIGKTEAIMGCRESMENCTNGHGKRISPRFFGKVSTLLNLLLFQLLIDLMPPTPVYAV